ncbi:hypothetical protein [Microtetraspora malaysiensis]|uniref:hypothetical protein n=1 Tax=Microtetraspora malaysiensis TaxID=161358 RepID=UPI0012FC9145|nr:hypothetical protein [Microtetraspora malaysiensis]
MRLGDVDNAAPTSGGQPCDGSSLQDWTVRAEQTDSTSPTGWYTYRPRTNCAR